MSTQSEYISTLNDAQLELDFPTTTQKQLAWADLKEGIAKWPIWLMLAYQDIKLRYRRSVLGPFWITLSMAITVYSMGYLYGHLFHVQLEHYFPFLVAGMLSWTLISTILSEVTEGFVHSDGLIKQIKLPYSLYIHRIASRNIIIFFHNILVIIPVLIYYHQDTRLNWHSLLLAPGLLLIYFNALTYGLLLAMVGARYRDISQVIKSLINVIFFITPVMWSPEVLGQKHFYLIDLNPFYAFIELIRSPLLGVLPSFKNLLTILIITVFGFMMSFHLLTRYRARIVYWL
jgi:lipopolysaccharide transport system permease protein